MTYSNYIKYSKLSENLSNLRIGVPEELTTTTGTTATATVPEGVSETGFPTTTPRGLHISVQRNHC